MQPKQPTLGLLSFNHTATGSCTQVYNKAFLYKVASRLQGQSAEVIAIVLDLLADAVEREHMTGRERRAIIEEIIEGKEQGAGGAHWDGCSIQRAALALH